MKSPYNTRPYALKARPGASRRRDLMMYTAIFAGPAAATVMAVAVAMASR